MVWANAPPGYELLSPWHGTFSLFVLRAVLSSTFFHGGLPTTPLEADGLFSQWNRFPHVCHSWAILHLCLAQR